MDRPRTAVALLGQVRSVEIPATTTAFRPRRAELYLPPILRTAPHTRLPVLELLHGTPGSPADWVAHGEVRETMDAFAATHGGRAPIVVMPDINGTPHGDTECVRTPAGADVESYLAVDVPRWVRLHYRTQSGPTGWAIGGLSEGGTCALMLALRHTSTWSTVADLSGLARPTVGDTDDEAATVARLFAGDRAAYNAHDPLRLLALHRYPRLGLWLECGTSDRLPLAVQRRMAPLARRARAAVVQRAVTGKHSWTVWAPALRQFLPWMWTRAG